MAQTNIKIINDLQDFLEIHTTERESMEKYLTDKNAFTRDRLLSLKTIILLILSALRRSLQVELECFFISTSCSCVTKQAFSKARSKLSGLFFKDWNHLLSASYYLHKEKELKRWKGKRVWALDGTTLRLCNTKHLKEAFAESGQKGVVMARLSLLYDVLNHLIIDTVLHPYTISEENVSYKCIGKREDSDLIFLFDRGYPSWWLMFWLMHHYKGSHFLMRCQRNFNHITKEFLKSSKKDIIVDLPVTYGSRKKLKQMGIAVSLKETITVRLVKIKLPSGETELLITSLLESSYKREDLKELYRLRYRIETCFFYLKNTLHLEQFSGLRVSSIEQDLEATLFLYNLQSVIQSNCDDFLKAVQRKRKYPYQINRKIAFGILKTKVIDLFLSTETTLKIISSLQKIFLKYLQPIRIGRAPRRYCRKKTPLIYTFNNYRRVI